MNLHTDSEWEELYTSRSLQLLWRVFKGSKLLSVSAGRHSAGVEIWLRQDEPEGPPFLRKLTFTDAAECEAYLLAKRTELEAEGWREDTQS
jgi:hypothetical protein